ncbi:hypothetical protein C8Q79DRAFT_978518 [Trametes meyenii]|nr:hypothetical protein C8Q79DRAFT_978518 [Trametes meyenii]
MSILLPKEACLLQLPEETKVDILKRLGFKSLLDCRLVCKSLRDTIQDSLQLQYNIELGADGLVDGSGCPMTVAERYALLMDRRRRWRELDWKQVESFKAPGWVQAYELVDGMFATSMGIGLSGSEHLQLTWLPTRNGPLRTVEVKDLGITVRDFAIDPSQDLIALVLAEGLGSPTTLSVHLRTLSGNKPHPDARKPELDTPVPASVGSSFIQIVDDVIGMFFHAFDPGLVIWNWRTGQTVVRLTGPEFPAHVSDFAFISSRAYMITTTSSNGPFELFSHGGAIELFTFRCDDADADAYLRSPTRVAVLQLPALRQGRCLTHFFTHSAPFVARPTPGRPFEMSPDCRLHVMDLDYGNRAPCFSLFVRNNTFLSYLPPWAPGEVGADFTPVIKSWEEWGPDNSRLTPLIAQFNWLRYVHGERVALPPKPTFDGDPRMALMTVIDFNVHPTRQEVLPLAPPEGTQCKLVTDAELVVDDEHFIGPVESRLPYMMVLRLLPREALDYSGLIIDHEHLVGMRSGSDDYVDLDVYTF